MAYDLIFGNRKPSFARGAGPVTHTLEGIGLLAVVGALLVPRMMRRAEGRQYRQAFAYGHKRTMEMPVMPMAEIMRRPWSTNQ